MTAMGIYMGLTSDSIFQALKGLKTVLGRIDVILKTGIPV